MNLETVKSWEESTTLYVFLIAIEGEMKIGKGEEQCPLVLSTHRVTTIWYRVKSQEI